MSQLERRYQQRRKGILPVRISGTDREGKAFSEHVCTIDISDRGTRLAGVRACLAVGDTVNVRFRNRQACFRVKWIMSGSTPTNTHVGVEALEPEKELWPIETN